MFEVEKRLKLTPEEIKKITKNSKSLPVQIFKNTYYDDPSFSLIRQKVWLRKRSNRY
jgi:inorganic triphosphatase YgiF